MLLERERYEDAVAWCRQALDRGHASPRIRLVLGRALIALRREDEAEKELRAHLQQNPRDAEAYRMLGEITFREDRYPESRRLLNEALRLAPADDSTRMLLDIVRGVEKSAAPADSRSADVRAVMATLELPHPVSTEERRPVLPAPPPPAPAPRAFWTTGAVVVAAVVVFVVWLLSPWARTRAKAAASVVAAPVARPSSERPAPQPTLPRELRGDAWIHPLDGPVRRMPTRDCVNGHCGVNLGETWGEPVMAVHDGVIDRVQRGPNPDHGGMYVRIAHRGGRIFTQYFHLAGIPRRIAPGIAVRMGEVIGIVGDTGVKQSGPHLHFTISVRPTRHGQERYIDPEPLIALWPLRVSARGGTVDTEAAPGLPRGASASRR